LQKDEAVLRQGIVRIKKINIGISERTAHIADGRPVPFWKLGEKLHGLHHWRAAHGAEGCGAAIRPIQPLSVIKV